MSALPTTKTSRVIVQGKDFVYRAGAMLHSFVSRGNRTELPAYRGLLGLWPLITEGEATGAYASCFVVSFFFTPTILSVGIPHPLSWRSSVAVVTVVTVGSIDHLVCCSRMTV